MCQRRGHQLRRFALLRSLGETGVGDRHVFFKCPDGKEVKDVVTINFQ